MRLKNITAEGWLEFVLFCTALGGIVGVFLLLG